MIDPYFICMTEHSIEIQLDQPLGPPFSIVLSDLGNYAEHRRLAAGYAVAAGHALYFNGLHLAMLREGYQHFEMTKRERLILDGNILPGSAL